jgi:beta-xylosidase
MRWINDWPVMGEDADGDGKGEPVMHYRKPKIKTHQSVQTPVESDEFNGSGPGLQWQWMANPAQDNYFMMPAAGSLRLYARTLPDSAQDIRGSNNVLLQKFPAEEFMATAKMKWTPSGKREESAGITIMGLDYAGLGLSTINGETRIVFHSYMEGSGQEKILPLKTWTNDIIYLRVIVKRGANCQFSFSGDGISFYPAGENFLAKPGKWKGAKVGIYCKGVGNTNDTGYADFDWFRIEKVAP